MEARTSNGLSKPAPKGAEVPRHRPGLRTGLLALVALGVLAVAAPAASAAPWRCDNTAYTTMYRGDVGENTVLSRVDRNAADGTYTLTEIQTVPTQLINALGFRVQDGFMYAYNNSTQRIMRVEDNGAGGAIFTELPAVAGLPAFGAFVGTFLDNGTYFLFGTPQNPIGYIIDVSGPVPTVITQVTPTWDASDAGRPIGDASVNPVDGKLYAALSDGVHELIIAGASLSIGPVVATSGPGSGGAQWFSPYGAQGELVHISSHADGRAHLYETDMASGQLRDLGPINRTIPNADGTACANTVAITKNASSRSVEAGKTFEYQYTIVSRGQAGNMISFRDQLPAGLKYVSGGVAHSPALGSVNAYADTRLLEISSIALPKNETMTITAQVKVAEGHACEVVPNQAQATMSTPGLPDVTIQSDDPDTVDVPNDPTEVDVKCTAKKKKPKLRLSKKVNKHRVKPGEVVRYTLNVRNISKVDARKARVCDNLAEQISLVSLGGGELKNGKLCWDLGTVKAGMKKKVSFTARVDRDADPGRMPNVATLKWPGGKDRDKEAIKIRDEGDIDGDGGDIEGVSQVTGRL